MPPGMTNGNVKLRSLINKLKEVLKSLDENDLAVPAIKVEEAINALKLEELDESESTEKKS